MVKVGTAYQFDNFSGTPADIVSDMADDFPAAKQSALLKFGATSIVRFFSATNGGGTVVGVLTPATPAVVFSEPALSYEATATAPA